MGSISSALSALSLLSSPSAEAPKAVSNFKEDTKYSSLLHKKLRKCGHTYYLLQEDF